MKRTFYIDNRRIKIEVEKLLGWQFDLFIKNNYRIPARRICMWAWKFSITIWIYDSNS